MKRKTVQILALLKGENRNQTLKSKNTGFTLIELLIVIAILAILAVVVLLLLNPAETSARARDSKRLTDMQTLQEAIVVISQEVANANLCVGGTQGSGTSCTGSSTAANASSNAGSGWIKFDFTQVAAGSGSVVQIASLPLDPINTAGASGFRYTYCTNNAATSPTWELATKLEAGSNASKMQNDGGTQATLYELGTSTSLIVPSGATTSQCNF